jgi:sugar lactone lactonase YvrE
MIGKKVRFKGSLLFRLFLLAASLLLIASAPAAGLPDTVPLPNGFQPEGIASGRGGTFYVGSIPTGAIYRGDLNTGQGAVLVPAQAGHQAIGLKWDKRTNWLFVSGGPTGMAFVYDAASGAEIAAIPLVTPPGTFVNDVILTNRAAYFTDSFHPVLYRVPLLAGGTLPDPPVVEVVPLGGEYVFTPGTFNNNGIAATPNGKSLIVVNSAQGALYLVDASSGDATLIDLGGGSVPAGDGILLKGKTLYVVQNRLNQVAVVQLAPDLTSGTISELITNPLFRVPTTIADFGKAIYAVNARFGTPPTPETDYDVVRVLPAGSPYPEPYPAP